MRSESRRDWLFEYAGELFSSACDFLNQINAGMDKLTFPTQPLTPKGALLVSRLVFHGLAAKAIQHDLIYAQDT